MEYFVVDSVHYLLGIRSLSFLNLFKGCRCFILHSDFLILLVAMGQRALSNFKYKNLTFYNLFKHSTNSSLNQLSLYDP